MGLRSGGVSRITALDLPSMQAIDAWERSTEFSPVGALCSALPLRFAGPRIFRCCHASRYRVVSTCKHAGDRIGDTTRTGLRGVPLYRGQDSLRAPTCIHERARWENGVTEYVCWGSSQTLGHQLRLSRSCQASSCVGNSMSLLFWQGRNDLLRQSWT